MAEATHAVESRTVGLCGFPLAGGELGDFYADAAMDLMTRLRGHRLARRRAETRALLGRQAGYGGAVGAIGATARK